MLKIQLPLCSYEKVPESSKEIGIRAVSGDQTKWEKPSNLCRLARILEMPSRKTLSMLQHNAVINLVKSHYSNLVQWF